MKEVLSIIGAAALAVLVVAFFSSLVSSQDSKNEYAYKAVKYGCAYYNENRELVFKGEVK